MRHALVDAEFVREIARKGEVNVCSISFHSDEARRAFYYTTKHIVYFF